ncbi:hypothetical protein SAMN02745157_1461 [Kaistia soli DSM 19436]|uniref:Uncharacterized protein n=1 Tax=Kaistia soli DSM 19436 TaxID=1122133 RepID=A0A1M4Y9M8_9HYPH|nr:hypothetical protein [Kaistia soli]SHF02338.1 hypothetical protein SAMN02745157_1461 [Kaistia soli DSM 19436]
MAYKVIAECVDQRSGVRLFPGDLFEDPTEEQFARLVRAGCLHPKKVSAKAKPAKDAPGADDQSGAGASSAGAGSDASADDAGANGGDDSGQSGADQGATG